LNRRELLVRGGFGLAGTVVAGLAGPVAAPAQAPRRGGTVSIRAWDPPHFDPYLSISYKTQVVYSFTHSRLLRHRAGPSVTPGTFPIEGDLAESWSQPNDTTYVFNLRKGVRWHAKPPVNGRELTAEDVVYSLERFRTVTGNANASMLAAVDRAEALDRYTLRLTLKEPFAWLLEVLSNPMAVAIVARESVEKFGDLKRAEALVGTGPWMLEKYDQNVGVKLTRNPGYFLPSLPYIERVELLVDEDNGSRMSAFLSGRYALGWEFPGTINRVDWVQIRDTVTKRRALRTAEFADNVMSRIYMRTDRTPFSDVRVRRAMSLAVNRRRLIDAVFEGIGVYNPPVPAALKEWSLPVVQLGDAARYYRYDPAEAKRLLAEAGYPSGFPATVDFTTYGSTVLVDAVQLILKDLKDVGIDAKLNQKEYGAYVSTTVYGKYDSMAYGPLTPYLDPDNFLYGPYYPGHPRNLSHSNDPVAADLLVRQRRTLSLPKRRELIHELQRYLAAQQYYVQMPSPVYVAVWDEALKNYGPNLGYDYGGRLLQAWLDR
jgi:peptide/nickel transport system substrate-binding protein